MIDYLLDTNIVSDVARHPHGSVAQRIARIGERRIGVSIIVAAELRFGVVRIESVKLAQQVEMALSTVEVLPFEPGCDRYYARVRSGLERRGLPIGAHDMLIAAHALAIDATLVTDNVREFEPVDGLRIENWLR